MPRLALTRRSGQRIDIDGPCQIEFVSTRNGQAKVVIVAEREVTVLRGEVSDREKKTLSD